MLSPVEKKDGNEVLGLKVSFPSLGGAWPIVDGALTLFAELVRSRGPCQVTGSAV